MILASTLGWILRVAVGVVLLVGVYLIGAATIRQFTAEPAPEPDPDDTVPVDLHYRCSVCGAEVVMTAAQDAEPDPPRHCREPMVLV